MKQTTKKVIHKLIATILATVILFALAAIHPLTAYAAGEPDGQFGDVIVNYPYAPTASAALNDVVWTHIKNHTGYDQAYTDARSEEYNGKGAATPDHAVVKGNQISFYGYGEEPYLDYVFTENVYPASRGNAFIMRPVWMNYHSFSESGYLFNGTMETVDGKTRYTGYAVTLSCENAAGMLESSQAAPNTASLRLYYIENEIWDADAFKPGSAAGTRTLIATFKTGITDVNADPLRAATPYRVNTETDPVSRAFKVYIDGSLRVSVPAEDVLPGGTGFGFYTGHYSHDCDRLTCIRFEDVTVNVDTFEEAASASVRFVDTEGRAIRVTETETGMAWQRYGIKQPLSVKYEGDDYYLIGNSPGKPGYGEIKRYYYPDQGANETTLYYAKKEALATRDPVKDARVDGGEWDNGAPGGPVPVTAGSEIEYAVTVYNAPDTGRAVMKGGNSGMTSNSSWFGQPSPDAGEPKIEKKDVKTAAFIDLPDRYISAAEFLDSCGSEWEGNPIVRVWDATETGSPDKVFAWVTDSAEGGYDLRLGGYGGVSLSDGENLFSYFSALKSADLENLRTGDAVSMVNMFKYCPALTELDLSGFDTSNVTDMSFMFNFCSGLTGLDLGSFNTSRVTSMWNMFADCLLLAKLNLGSFDTSSVTSMEGMFTGCASLTRLNLSSFDVASVRDMSYMFSECRSLADLNVNSFNTMSVKSMASMFFGCETLTGLVLYSFNTSSVENMTAMFRGCETLTALELSSFDTSRVTSMAEMFYGCASLGSVDLSTFDTVKVKSMHSMFKGCESLEALSVNHFDMTAVSGSASGSAGVSYMFDGCESLTELDLSWWNLDISASSNKTSFINMISGCGALAEVHLEIMTCGVENGDKIDSLIGSASGFADGFTVFVRDENVKAGLTSGGLAEEYVMEPRYPETPEKPEAAAPDVADPEMTDWRDEFYPPAAPGTPGFATVTDTIPAGLKIIESSITGRQGALSLERITWTLEGRTITWMAPEALLPAVLTVKATVQPGAAGTLFENFAVSDGTDTNFTYHAIAGGYRVTEKYLLFTGSVGDIGSVAGLDEDLTAVVDEGSVYEIQGNTRSLYGYAYYGYRLNGAGPVIQEQPPVPVFDGSATGHKTIELYYTEATASAGTTDVTVHFLDKNGKPLKPDVTEEVPVDMDYYMPMHYMDSFDAGGKTWVYYDYENTVPAGSPPQPGGAPNRPDASRPTFTIRELAGGGKEIALYFTADVKVVTVRFAEQGNPSNILHDDEMFFFESELDLAAQTRTGGKALTGDIDLSAEYGRVYAYTGCDSTSGGLEVYRVSGEVTLFFATVYDYTVTVNGSNAGTTGAGTYRAGETVTINAGSKEGFTFDGWTVDYGGAEPESAASASTTFIMPGNNVTVTAKWKSAAPPPTGGGDGGGGGGGPDAYNVKVTGSEAGDDSGSGDYEPGTTVTIKAGERPGWTFKGWRVDKGNIDPENTGGAVTTFIMPDEDVEVTAIWEENPKPAGTVTLLISKVLLGADGARTGTGREFTVILYGADNNEIGQYTLRANEAAVEIHGLPSGTSYTIKERAAPGFRAESFEVRIGWITIGAANGSGVRLNVRELTRDKTIRVVVTNKPGTQRPEPEEPAGIDVPDGDIPLNPFIAEHAAYIIGYPEGDVRPNRNISRAEAATVFFRLLTDEIRAGNWAQTNPFSDVNVGNWYNNAVSVMNGMGIVNGYADGTFNPGGAITRAEMASIASRFARVMEMPPVNSVSFGDISGHWAEADVLYAASVGWITGYPDGTFRPDQSITRAEFMTMVNRMLERISQDDGDLLKDEMVTWADNADPGAWYYLAVQEATNSHLPEYKDAVAPNQNFRYERWAEMAQNRDWQQLEQIWVEQYS